MKLRRIAIGSALSGALLMSLTHAHAVSGDPYSKPGYVNKDGSYGVSRRGPGSASAKAKGSKSKAGVNPKMGKAGVTKPVAALPASMGIASAAQAPNITDLGVVTERTRGDAEFRIGTASSPCLIKQAMTDAEIQSCRSR